MNFRLTIPAMYSIAVMLTAMPANSSSFSPAVSTPFFSPTAASTNRIHRPKPYRGTYGPTQKPGLIHFRSGFAPDRKRRYSSSATQPSVEPIKNRYASVKNKFISVHHPFCRRKQYQAIQPTNRPPSILPSVTGSILPRK